MGPQLTSVLRNLLGGRMRTEEPKQIRKILSYATEALPNEACIIKSLGGQEKMLQTIIQDLLFKSRLIITVVELQDVHISSEK